MEYRYHCLKKNAFQYQGGYSLRPIHPDDIESIRVWRNDQIDILRQKEEITPEAQRAYFNAAIWPLFQEKQPRQLLFSLFLKDQLIGYGGLTYIDWDAKRGEVSFLTDTKRQNLIQDDFYHYLNLLSQMTFEELGFHRIFTETYAFRKDILQILDSFGFQYEGRLREHVYKRGKWMDSIFHGLLNTDNRNLLHKISNA